MRRSSPIASETVRAVPGMSAETVVLTTYRHDGRPFIRMELPAELVPEFIGDLERCTKRHDATVPAPIQLVK